MSRELASRKGSRDPRLVDPVGVHRVGNRSCCPSCPTLTASDEQLGACDAFALMLYGADLLASHVLFRGFIRNGG